MILIKIGLIAFLIFWFTLGGWLVARYSVLFGPHKDDPAESPGARSFGVAHIIAVWIGGAAIGFYYLFK